MNGFAPRHGDGRRRQSVPRVGVVRRIGAQVLTRDIAVELGADALRRDQHRRFQHGL